ncbi:MAG: helix-hairpin-helix domain-containing protein [Bacilli bacterium]|jgi:competence protein ComEA
MIKTIIAVVVATVFLIITLTAIDPKNKRVDDTPTSLVENEYNNVTVTGEINRPGTYVLEEGATMDVLLMEAGGPTNNADARAYIETTPIIAGMSYYIAPIKDVEDICGILEYDKVNINYDTKEKLMQVNGIGDAVASRIITYRENTSRFTYLEEIMKVDGIKQATFEKIKNYITLR